MKRFECDRPRPVLWYFLLPLGLIILFSSGCRDRAEQDRAGSATAAPKTASSADQESQPHAHDGATSPHRDRPADQQGIRLSVAARTNLNLQIAEAMPRRIEQILRIPGVVKAHPDRLAHVTPRLEARIEKVYVNVGDTVQQGAPLLDLSSVEVEKLQVELLSAVKNLGIVEQSYKRTKELTEKTVLNELEDLQQELIKTHGELQLAAAAVERGQRLSEKIVARKDLLAAQTEHQQARGAYDAIKRKLRTYGITEAQVRTIMETGLEQSVLKNLGLSPEAAVQKYLILGEPGELFELEAEYREKRVEVESLKRQLQILGFSTADLRTILRRGVPKATFTLAAPITGTVIVREATPGAVVEPAETLIEIVDTSVVWVEGDVTENLLAMVHAGQVARVRVVAYPEAVFTGTVRTIGRTVDPDKRTVHLWVEVTNPEDKLLPEMFANVTVVTQMATEALAVPHQSVIGDGAEKFVFVQNGDAYTKQNVVLGLKDDRYVEIRDGIFPGDRIVIRGGYELNSINALAPQQAQGGDGHGGHAH